LFFAASVVSKVFRFERETAGSFVIGCQILNVGMFGFSLFFLLYGDAGLSRVLMFDFGNALLAFTLGYFTAVTYGSGKVFSLKQRLVKCFSLPMVWAFAAAIVVNYSGFSIPQLLFSAVDLSSRMVLPLFLVSLGLFFEPVVTRRLKPLVAGLLIKMVGGLLVGLAIAALFKLQNLDKVVVVVLSVMPAGYNSMVYAAKEGLDEEFAASFVSITIIASLLVVLIILPLL